jgi:hypothetical protein
MGRQVCRRGGRARRPSEKPRDRLQHQMRRRVVVPIGEDLAGFGEAQLVDIAVGVAAAGGEGAVDGGELRRSGLAIPGAAVADGPSGDRSSPGGCKPPMRKTAATAVLSSATPASRSRIASAVNSGWAGINPAATTCAAATISAPPDLPAIASSASSTCRSWPSFNGRKVNSRAPRVMFHEMVNGAQNAVIC